MKIGTDKNKAINSIIFILQTNDGSYQKDPKKSGPVYWLGWAH